MKQTNEMIHITQKMTGKMEGMQSISTSCLCNDRCLERMKNNEAICKHCYACAQMKMYKNMQACFKRNSEVLSNSILNDSDLPLINASVFRFEAFGDLINDTHVINYFNICKKNPRTTFALWTKNPDFIAKAIANGYNKPENLIIILSSLIVNKQQETKYDFIDKIFTVYDKDFIKANDIDINCGARNCLACQRCYTQNGERYIREKLK